MYKKILVQLNDYVDGTISLNTLNDALYPFFSLTDEDKKLKEEMEDRANDELREIFYSIDFDISEANSRMIDVSQSDIESTRGNILRFLALFAHAPNSNNSEQEEKNAKKIEHSLHPRISLKTLARMREMGISILDLDRATRHSNRIRKTIFFGLIYSDVFGRNWKYYDEEQDLFVIVDDGDVCAIARGRPNV